MYYATSSTQKSVLCFAAASNNRVYRPLPVGYPARIGDRVICINSSTAHDERSSFSPRGIAGASNLSTIGENVEAAWPPGLNGGQPWMKMSGTSCATPIAVGIAALVLEFARKDAPELQHLDGWNRRKAELWETVGMRSVLKRHMTEMYSDGEYNFLKPWRLLKEPAFQAIALRIIEALDFKYDWGGR